MVKYPTNITDIDYEMMNLAIQIAEKAGTPFGAVIRLGDEPVVTAVNTTKKTAT